ncbi:MAG: hypothetical protein DAHOPDDO_01234 [Ignavibacteriaceae bacterium]|nr:MAG: hypothetical protein EDM72_00565 [Chlorobiota bacterium]MBL1123051.1 hypothetical protein [Ignavibacteriota bacterium]MBV6420008.1 hypothetical protein [Ignavibacteriaceae bacterium]MCE7855735.1 hypothetical protein [Ignavibacteria bacterium CHB3]GIK59195.1 MAG: hypothetical protein BroJett017_00850 [Ignavibacteriota bacterium]
MPYLLNNFDSVYDIFILGKNQSRQVILIVKFTFEKVIFMIGYLSTAEITKFVESDLNVEKLKV